MNACAARTAISLNVFRASAGDLNKLTWRTTLSLTEVKTSLTKRTMIFLPVAASDTAVIASVIGRTRFSSRVGVSTGVAMASEAERTKLIAARTAVSLGAEMVSDTARGSETLLCAESENPVLDTPAL